MTGQPAAIGDQAGLGRALRELRTRRGLTVRALAEATGIARSTLSGWENGDHLPPALQMTPFLTLLSTLGVPEADHPAWSELVDRLRVASRRTAARGATGAPYRGLEAFGPDDAELFFGREDLVDVVVSRLREVGAPNGTAQTGTAQTGTAQTGTAQTGTAQPGTGGYGTGRPPEGRLARLVVVVGHSGSGKSSLLRAGVVPRVRAGALGRPGTAAVVTPGDDLAAALAPVSTVPPRLLVVDQFEELFTLVPEAGRAAGLDALAALPAGTTVVAALRADFWPAAAQLPDLVGPLTARAVVVGPMAEPDLREVIVRPAALRGVAVDDDLVEAVFADLREGRVGGAARPQALPLLSHALLTAWNLRTGPTLTRADYLRAGGLDRAVAQTADAALDELGDSARTVARRVFLRLVTVDAGGVASRRPASRAELDALGGASGEPDDARPVIERFVARRLLTVDEDAVELSHEALLTAWPQLRTWVETDVRDLQQRHAIGTAAEVWAANGEDGADLLRGPRLQVASAWAQESDQARGLTAVEQRFLDTSRAAGEARDRAARRGVWVRRGVVAALVVAVVATTTAFGIALDANATANRERRATAEQRDLAISRQLAALSARVAAVDPALAQQVALAGYETVKTPEARNAVLDTTAGGIITRVPGRPGPTTARLSPDGRWIAVSDADTGAVVLRPMRDDRPGDVAATVPPAAAGPQVFALAWSRDGATLAIGDANGGLRTVDVTDPAVPGTPRTLGAGLTDVARGVVDEPDPAVQAVAFGADGRTLYAAGGRAPLRAFDLTSARATDAAGTGRVGGAAVAVTPDGRSVLAGDDDGTVRAWPVADLTTAPRSLDVGDGSALTTLDVSPDGRQLLAGTKGSTLRVLAVGLGSAGRVLDGGFTSWVNAAAWSGDGSTLAAGGSDGRLVVFTAAGTVLSSAPSPAPVTAVGFAADGRAVLAATADGTLTSRAPSGGLSVPGRVFTLDWQSAGLAVAWTGDDGAAGVWTDGSTTGREVRRPALPADFRADGTVALAPDGRVVALGAADGSVAVYGRGDDDPAVVRTGALIEGVAVTTAGDVVAAGSDDRKVHVWDVEDPGFPQNMGVFTTGNLVIDVAFSPDGNLLAAASADRTVHLYRRDGSTFGEVAELGGFDNYAWSVAFSPDNRWLVAGGADDTVRLWDVTDPTAPRSVGGVLTGPTRYVWAVAVRPDGREFAAAGGDGTVWTWPLGANGPGRSNGALRGAGDGTGLYALSYRPDGGALAAAGTAGRLTTWSTDADDVVAQVCARGGAVLTETEWQRYVPDQPYRRPCS